MKHCDQCNLDFPATYRFCGSCGGGLNESITCDTCGEIVELKWKYCTGCGRAFAPLEAVAPEVSSAVSSDLTAPQRQRIPVRSAQSDSPGRPVREWYAAPELFDEPDETTAASMRVQHMAASANEDRQRPFVRAEESSNNGIGRTSGNGKDVPTLTMLSAYGQPEAFVATEPPRRYPILLGLVLIVFFAALGFGGWYVWSHRTSAASAEPAEASSQTEARVTTGSSAASAGETPAERAVIENSADDEWKRLREQRTKAQPSEREAIIASLEQAEKKYPNDYRFPYERAKLSIKGIVSHHEAFDALADAAGKAIDNGKAQEMLANLTTDKEGDFWKLARGHHEWHALMEALTTKDKSELGELHH